MRKLIGTTIVYSLGIITSFSILKTTNAQLANPLLIDHQDPLIPKGYGKRELSSFEKYRIEQEITKLDKAAQDELEGDNITSAMKLYYRQLRLIRIIDSAAEIKALGKVGAIAWEKNSTSDVRNIARRLMVIQEEEKKQQKSSLNQLNNLAVAYEKVRYLDKAIDVYQQILIQNKADEYQILEKLGELYLAIFDSDHAANIYQKMLTKTTSQQEAEILLQTLIKIYDSSNKTSKAISIKEQLIEQYTQENKPNKISALENSIARDREILGETDQALEAYHRALELALNNQQFALASDALRGIGKLYQQQSNFTKAIDTYNMLLTIEKQSYNYYGLVNTYDNLGKIYLKLGLKNKANQSFIKGLDIAKTIQYKVEYFRDFIK